ncbi:MAG: class I SAM-dependent methyltransferase [bacterium]|nr:class I SAM-dependent methyltransferase [bacterium]
MICLICQQPKLNILTKQLRDGTSRRVFHCPSCQLGILEEKKINVKQYYTEDYRKNHSNNLEKPNSKPEGIFRTEKNFQGDRLRIIKRFFSKKKTFLEVGCSAGQFISQVKDRFKMCAGVELDTHCARYVQKKFGLEVKTDPLENCDFQEKKFDYIAAFQTLEHIQNPLQFLAKAKDLLSPSGKVFIEVPNLHDALLSLWPADAYRKFYFHDAHTFYFSPKSLKKLCQKAGFKIDKMYFLQDYNFFNHFFWYFNNAPQSNSSFGLSQPQINFSGFSPKASREINQLIQDADQKYKDILSHHRITSNIFIVASKA